MLSLKFPSSVNELALLIVRFSGHGQPGNASGRPGGLKVEAARNAVDVECFADDVEGPILMGLIPLAMPAFPLQRTNCLN
jgi:hypothetical protein